MKYHLVLASSAVIVAGAAVSGVLVMAPEAESDFIDYRAPIVEPERDVQALAAQASSEQDPQYARAKSIQDERNVEQLIKEYREAPNYLPPLPYGSPDRLQEVIWNTTRPPLDPTDPDRDSIQVFEPGYFRSIFAMHWHCAWAKEAVEAHKAGDAQRVEEAITILESFKESELAASFPTYDTKLENLVYPIRNGDYDNYYQRCEKREPLH